jgi:hypothetical protein
LDEINILRETSNPASLGQLEEAIEDSYTFYELVSSKKQECQICFEECFVNERQCCKFIVCNSCINLYIQTQIKACCGNVIIECLNAKCTKLMHRDEITERMSRFDKATLNLYLKFLIDANNDPACKTCPRCSHPMVMNGVNNNNNNNNTTITSTYTSTSNTTTNNNNENRVLQTQKVANKKQYGLKNRLRSVLFHEEKKNNSTVNLNNLHFTKVQCKECRLIWCFQCQSPWHDGITCDQFKKGDRMLKYWAKEVHYGQQNAQSCPKCKIYIQRTKGCDHMVCIHCSTEFCYKCGERFRNVKFIGKNLPYK